MQFAAFALVCVIWGLTWIAMKVGVAAVPPMLFAGLRFTVAGGVLLGWCAWRRLPLPLGRRDRATTAAAAFLMVVATYGPLFWGMKFVASGLSAVLDLSIMPMTLLLIGWMLGEERLDRRRLLAIAVGTAGLLILLGPKALDDVSGTPMELLGSVAIMGSTVAYAWGSVLARPLTRRCPPEALAGTTLFAGGVVLLALALAAEPGAWAALRGDWGWAAWAGWGFLVLFGSLLAYTLYLRLLRDWGPVRAGSYAFVSPGIAVVAGVLTLGEQVTVTDILGMAAMLAGAWLCIPRQRVAEPA